MASLIFNILLQIAHCPG